MRNIHKIYSADAHIADVNIGFNSVSVKLTQDGIREIKALPESIQIEYLFERSICSFGYCLVDDGMVFVKSNCGLDWSFFVDNFSMMRIKRGSDVSFPRGDALQRRVWGVKNIPQDVDLGSMIRLVQSYPDLAKKIASLYVMKMSPIDVLCLRVSGGNVWATNQLNESFLVCPAQKQKNGAINFSKCGIQFKRRIARYLGIKIQQYEDSSDY